MRSKITPSSLLGLFILFCIPALRSVCAENLELRFVQPDGTAYAEFIASDEGISLVTANGPTPVPDVGIWQLAGDLRGLDSRLVSCFPAFAIRKPRFVRTAPRVPDPYRAAVALVAGGTDSWTMDQLRGSIAVFGWVHQGRVVQVNPVPIRSFYLGPSRIAAVARFDLSEQHAEGAPFVLILNRGHLVARDARPEAGRLDSLELDLLSTDDEAVARHLDSSNLAGLSAASLSRLLASAAMAGRPQAVAALFQAAKITPSMVNGALEGVVGAGRRETLPILLQAAASMSAGRTAELIELAITNAHDECARTLVLSATARKQHIAGRERLATLALEQGLYDVLSTMLSSDRERFLLKFAESGFADAAERGDRELIWTLLKAGINPARVDRDATALSLAVFSRDHALLAALLTAGANPDPEGKGAGIPLVYAARIGDVAAARSLIAAHANVDRRSLLRSALGSAPGRGFEPDPVPWGKFRSESAATLNALEVALLQRHREAVRVLVEAGATISRDAAATREMVESIIAVDEPVLLRRILADGPKRKQPLTSGWNEYDLACAFEAEQCMHLLRPDATSPATLLWSEKMDSPPELLSTGLRPDLRRRDRDQPRVELLVQGIVDDQGRLRAARVSGSDNLELCTTVRRASESFQFTPARRNGKPVGAKIKFPLIFPEQPATEYAAGRLDLPPVGLHELRTRTVSQLSFPMPQSIVELLGDRRMVYDFEELRDYLNINDDARDITGDLMPSLRFIVGPDGRPRDAQVMWARDWIDRNAALKRLAGYQYLPGIAQGRAVSVLVTALVPAR